MTKLAANWLKSIPNLLPEQLKNHTLWGRTYLYSPYKAVPPWDHHPRLSCISMNEVKKYKFLPSTSFLRYCLYTLKWNITHLTSLSSGADIKSFAVIIWRRHTLFPPSTMTVYTQKAFLFIF